MKRSTMILSSSLALVLAALPAHAINDAQIASIVVTANQVDVEAGRVAVSKASADEVRRFGELMVNDHSGVNKAAVELVTKLGVAPEANPTSQSLEAAGKKNLAHLESLTGLAFDRAYIDHEVAYHRQVLQALDETLIPNAQNEDLAALLVKVKPAFVAHLEHAERIQSSLGGE